MRQVKMFGLLAIVAAALLVPAASASAQRSIECQFSGVTGALNPAIPSMVKELTTPGDTVVDQENGTFTFSGDLDCQWQSAAGPGSGPGQVTASGTYSNTVCGTGTATGTSRLDVPGAPGSPATAQFHIQFVGGNGAIQVNSLKDAGGQEAEAAGGDAQLVPVHNPGNGQAGCVNQDVSAFEVDGAVFGVWNP